MCHYCTCESEPEDDNHCCWCANLPDQPESEDE